ncbi:MAG: radical SAM protein, partial [bacterium]
MLWTEIKNQYLMYRCYRRRLVRLPYPPLSVWIEPTNICNLRCIMCSRSFPPQREEGFMDDGLFRTIIDRFGGAVPEISLHFAGEPMMHPRLDELIAAAAQNGIRVVIHTNATLLSEELSRRIITAGIHTLVISFDALTPSQYESMRIGASYEKTLRNIRTFLEVKKSSSRKNLFGKSRPFTTI